MDRVVTLTTDFGTADGYVGALKGVLTSLAPGARILDVTHAVPPQDVVVGAFALERAARAFPPGTIHLAVVDPTVGTGRRPVAAEAYGSFFVGPDNGLLARAAGARARVHVLMSVPGAAPSPSPTFHGRDLFAPAAAALARGVGLEALGPQGDALAPLALPVVERDGGGLTGTVLFLDRFGNAITNLTAVDIPTGAAIEIGGSRLALCRTYADVGPGVPLALIGSGGLVEVAVREGSAGRALGLQPGARLRVTRREKPTD